MKPINPQFSHERLEVYQLAIDFVAWEEETVDGLEKTGNIGNQLERAADSIVLNIAEGNGKRSPRDRAKFFQIATGSAYECAAALDVLVARKRISSDSIVDGKIMLARIVGMLVKLEERQTGSLREDEVSYAENLS